MTVTLDAEQANLVARALYLLERRHDDLRDEALADDPPRREDAARLNRTCDAAFALRMTVKTHLNKLREEPTAPAYDEIDILNSERNSM